jgi:hypothetical protein
MAKQLELYDTFPIKFSINDENKGKVMSDSSDGLKKDYSLVCEIDATHAGTLINNRIYPPESMQKGVKSWTRPYKKPVLVNHDDTADPVGRVIKAKYTKTPRGLESNDYKPVLKESDGYGYMRLTVRVTDPSAMQKILDGRYETVSVRMSTNHAFCSICSTDWSADGPCEHMPGQKYDGKLAYMTTGDLTYKEVSFVNIPADEYAGVKEALLVEARDQKKALDMSVYANSAEEKVLASLSDNEGRNLYSLLDSEIEESDEVVLHLLDRSSKVNKSHKEDEVKLEELKKDQLIELDAVKELIEEEVAKHREEDAKKAKSECDEALNKIIEECEQAKKDSEDCAKVKEELEKLKAAQDSSSDEAISEIKKENEELKMKVTSLNDEVKKKEEDRKRVLDENIKINSELHKMVAERLYDLKKQLQKPDVADIKTPDGRDKKVEEFAQRSVDSLKDQIADLILESNTTSPDGKTVNNPGASNVDKTNEVEDNKEQKPESKKEKLNRLFSKS